MTTPRAEGLAVARALLSERLLNARKTHLVRLGVLVFFGGLMAIRFFAVLPNVHGA